MVAEPLLRCDGLVRRFGERVAVDGVSFEVAAGETYGLLGPNGAGKTTTISLVAGILAPHAGTVTVDGRPVTTKASPAKAAIGLVPQEVALYPDLTAAENLRFFGRLQGMGKRDLARRIDEVLELVGLADRAKDRVDEFSGGMKRRANIAVGLLHGPRLLILDEPTVGVDPQSRHQILTSIEQLSAEGMGVLYTTHYMEEAERLCDRVGVMDQGRLVAEGTRRELVESIGAHDRIQVTTALHGERLVTAVRGLAGVVDASVVDGRVVVVADDAAQVLASVVEAGERVGAPISRIEVQEPDLEAVFLHLTGKALRD